jgi:hypothetical protein
VGGGREGNRAEVTVGASRAEGERGAMHGGGRDPCSGVEQDPAGATTANRSSVGQGHCVRWATSSGDGDTRAGFGVWTLMLLN